MGISNQQLIILGYNDGDLILGKLQRPHCDLTIIIVNKENHPQMAELFRLVKYYKFAQIYVSYRDYLDGTPTISKPWFINPGVVKCPIWGILDITL